MVKKVLFKIIDIDINNKKIVGNEYFPYHELILVSYLTTYLYICSQIFNHRKNIFSIV